MSLWWLPVILAVLVALFWYLYRSEKALPTPDAQNEGDTHQ